MPCGGVPLSPLSSLFISLSLSHTDRNLLLVAHNRCGYGLPAFTEDDLGPGKAGCLLRSCFLELQAHPADAALSESIVPGSSTTSPPGLHLFREIVFQVGCPASSLFCTGLHLGKGQGFILLDVLQVVLVWSGLRATGVISNRLMSSLWWIMGHHRLVLSQ